MNGIVPELHRNYQSHFNMSYPQEKSLTFKEATKVTPSSPTIYEAYLPSDWSIGSGMFTFYLFTESTQFMCLCFLSLFLHITLHVATQLPVFLAIVLRAKHYICLSILQVSTRYCMSSRSSCMLCMFSSD